MRLSRIHGERLCYHSIIYNKKSIPLATMLDGNKRGENIKQKKLIL